MKHLIYIVALFAILACDNMRDTNGTLGGMWQLTEWRDGTTVRATRDTAIYYSFQLQLMKIQSFRRTQDGFFHATFTHRGDSLLIGQVYQNKKGDHLVPLTMLQPYGVPQSGAFRVMRLTSDCLILTADEQTLTFRKY